MDFQNNVYFICTKNGFMEPKETLNSSTIFEIGHDSVAYKVQMYIYIYQQYNEVWDSMYVYMNVYSEQSRDLLVNEYRYPLANTTAQYTKTLFDIKSIIFCFWKNQSIY